MKATLVLLAVVAIAFGAPSSQRHVLNQGTKAPQGWTMVSPADATARLSFTLALPQQNLGKLQQTFERLSDPTSLEYGQYLTMDQVNSIVAPNKAIAAKVIAALPSELQCRDFGDAVRCEGAVKDIETALQTTLGLFRHDESGLTLIRQVGDMSVPVAIAEHVDFISPLAAFIAPMRRQLAARKPDAADLAIVPETITRMYNIQELGDARSTQGAAEFESVRHMHAKKRL